jgi:L-iditol 2-dehydrogenase
MRSDAEQMLGVTKFEAGRGHVELSPRPGKSPGPAEVLLEVASTGICGTDLHIWFGEYPSVPPVTLGHEICGVVVGVGRDVSTDWLQKRVAVETYYSTCGQCGYCRDGRANLCVDRKSLGTHVDGGMAPSVVLPAVNLHEVPAGLGDAPATLSEPLACICNAMMGPPAVQVGDRVLVVGPGAMGLLAAQVARACGGTVTVRGTRDDSVRLRVARELGFPIEVDGVEVDGVEVDGVEVDGGAARGRGQSLDVVVECSGSEQGVRYGLENVRRGGTFVLVGLRGADISVRFDLICFHEIVVRSGYASTPRSWEIAMKLIWGQKVELSPLISGAHPLSQWERAFNASRAREGVKYVLDPRL